MSKKPKGESPEYQLILSRKKGEDASSFVFTLRTVKEFRSFQYIISVDTEVGEKQIRFDIKGLQTPGIALPRSGPATYTREFADLKGQYEVIVKNTGGEENRFLINVRGGSVSMKEVPEKKFVEFVTELWQ